MTITCRIALTAEDRQACYQLRSDMYRRHYGNVPENGFSDLYDSAVLRHSQPQSNVVLAKYRDHPVGTLRSTVSWDANLPDVRSHATSLFNAGVELPGHLEAIINHRGAPLERVVEFNKMAVLPVGNHCEVLRAVFATAARVAFTQGVQYTLGVMTPSVARSLRIAGIHYRCVPSIRLCRDTPEQVRYLIKYHEYFLPSLRKTCSYLAEEETVASTPFEELRAAIAPCDDGPNLYWLSTEELLAVTENLV